MTEAMRENTARVVVGVDGSPSGDAALGWAHSYAQATGASLEIVTAWQFPAFYGDVIPPEDWTPDDEAKAVAEKRAATVSLPKERVRVRIEQGAAGEVLARASDGADLVVVGSRGRGGFAGLLLGSVSMHCVHRARCPVVVVR